jgi:putative dimethyl sulfoxide reductase chaperone
MNQIDYAASAEDRSRFFWWLAEWFLSPPSREKLASLPSTAEAEPPADAMDSAWLALANAAPDLEITSVDELGGEFTRLISGIQEGMGPPPPFESLWREDRLIGESTVAVIETYARAGFADIDPEAGPQDHVSVELKFMALLALREAEARRAADLVGARQRLSQQGDFLNRHLAAWAPRWADAVIQQARLPLFAALAGLLKAGLDQAALELNELTRQSAS